MGWQRHRRFGLRLKLLLLTNIIFVFVFSSATFFLVRRTTVTLRTSLQNEAKAFATLATKPIGESFLTFKDSGTLRINEEAKTFAGLNSNVTNIYVVDITGQEKFVLYSDVQRDSVKAASATSFDPVYEYGENGLLARIIYPFFESSGARRYSLVYDISSQSIQQEIRQQIILFSSLGLMTLLLTSAAIYLLIYDATIKPIRTLSQQAVAISLGNLEQQISVTNRDEIGELANAVSNMSLSLRKNIENLKEVDSIKTEFMNIVSHNLRTPLTIINGYTDSADLFTKPDQSKAAFEAISKAAKRLGRFSEDMLAVSNLELDKDTGERRPIDIVKLVTEVAAEMKKQAEDKHIHYSFSAAEIPGCIIAYAPHIRGSLFNLIDNAIKFTGQDGEVVVSVSYVEARNQVRIDVKDNGIGIPDDKQASLFTKFHRGTPTMEYNYEGVGIGLYASRMMIEHNSGQLIFASKQGVGSIFSIILPLQPKEMLEHAKDVPWGQYVAKKDSPPALSSQPPPPPAA